MVGILFLLLFLSFRGGERTELLETEGRSFERAEVVEVVQNNETESGGCLLYTSPSPGDRTRSRMPSSA